MSTIAQRSPTNSQATIIDLGPALLRQQSLATRLGATVRLWRRRLQERDQLARMTERELRDIGRTRSEVIGELAKPFWAA